MTRPTSIATSPGSIGRYRVRVMDEKRDHACLAAREPIVSIVVLDDRMDICATDVHLPRRICRALERAHDGELRIAFASDTCEIPIGWQR